MADHAKPADVALDRNIVGRVGEHDIGDLAIHQRGEVFGVERVAAEQPMASKRPEVADPADRALLHRRKESRRIGRSRLLVEAFDPHIDLAHVEAGRLEVEAEIHNGEFLQLFGQKPGASFGVRQRRPASGSDRS